MWERVMCVEARTGGAEGWRRFRSHFPGREQVFLSVIYAADEAQSLSNARIAEQAGADGAFLINCGIDCQRLFEIAAKVVERRGGMFVGVNCIDLPAQDVIRRLPDGVDGVWSSERPAAGPVARTASGIRQARREAGWGGLYFATALSGVHAAHIDVPTISGPGPGEPAVPVVRVACERFRGWPLALAADITSQSVDAFLPYVSCIMTTARVGIGLEEMDPEEAERLAARIHAC